MVTLTAGGKAAPALRPEASLKRWHETLTRMLECAVRYGELDALAKKRRAWCEANPFHELWDERYSAMWLTTQERNEAGAKMLDAGDELGRIQRQLSEVVIDQLAALYGHPLYPEIGQRWALVAKRTGWTDIADIASVVCMELRAESEETECPF